MAESQRVDVLILGAGFAGLTAARRLAPRNRVVVVDRNGYQTLRPKLPEAVGGTCACAARLPLTDALRGSHAELVIADVRGIDPEAHVVRTDAGELRYGRLIVALGSQPHVPAQVPGAAEFALPLWDFDHACDIRRRVTILARAASRAKTEGERRKLASVAVVGGGFVGVEVAGHLLDRLTELARAFGLPAGDVQVYVLEQASRLLPGFQPVLGGAVGRNLAGRGIRLHLATAVRAVTQDGVILADGSRLDAATVIWAGGVRAVRAIADLGAPTAGDRILVRPDLRATAWPDVYAAGDAAAVAAPGGGVLPQSAQLAMQAGEAVAASVARDLAGLAPRAYRPHERGVALGLGARDAVANLHGVGLAAVPARLLKDAALAHYLFGLGGSRLLGAYLAPVFLQPLRGRVEIGNPEVDTQKTDPSPRLLAR